MRHARDRAAVPLVLAEVDRADACGEAAGLTAALASSGMDVVREVTAEEAYTGGALAGGGVPR